MWGVLIKIAGLLPGLLDRFLNVAVFVQTVWRATDGGLKQLSGRYKRFRPGTQYQQIPQASPQRQVSPPPPYRAIERGSYRQFAREASDEDRALFYAVKGREPFTERELMRFLEDTE